MAAFDHVRNTVIGLGVSAALLAGSFGFVAQAHAAPATDGAGPSSQVCSRIESEMVKVGQAYQKATDPAQRASLLQDLTELKNDYFAAGCNNTNHNPPVAVPVGSTVFEAQS